MCFWKERLPARAGECGVKGQGAGRGITRPGRRVAPKVGDTLPPGSGAPLPLSPPGGSAPTFRPARPGLASGLLLHGLAPVLLLLACIERAVWVGMTGVSGNGYFVFPVTLGQVRKPLSI